MLGRKQHNHAQNKRKRKYKKKKCRQRRIDKNEEASQPLRPPKIAHQAPRLRSAGTNQHLQKGTRHGCQGFPSVRGEERRRVAPTPSRKVQRHPQAPPRWCQPSQQGFLPIPTSTSGTPDLATKPTTNLRQPGHEAPHAVSPRHREAWPAQ